jgi:hypothetical protein
MVLEGLSSEQLEAHHATVHLGFERHPHHGQPESPVVTGYLLEVNALDGKSICLIRE